MSFYRKYRPQNIEELDNTKARETLLALIKRQELPHAFLFAGPRGTGKTSAARILAKIVNCTGDVVPCGTCSSCTGIATGSFSDVIELDAASNRGIDDVRLIREEALLTPMSGKKKVYIIDEAHMLTTEAANALLKTLEEPPSHVVFILATTDPQKLPKTVRSRLTEVIFEKATGEEIARQLARVSKAESIKIPEAAIKIISMASDGSFRDAAKILEDLVIKGSDFSEVSVMSLITKGGDTYTSEIIEYIQSGDFKKLSDTVESYRSKGVSGKEIVDNLINALYEAFKKGDQSLFTKAQAGELIEKLIKSKEFINLSPVEELPLLLTLFNWINKKKESEKEVNPILPKVKEETILKKKTIIENHTKETKKDEEKIPLAPVKNSLELTPDSLTNWAIITSKTRERNSTLEALLRASKLLTIGESEVTVGVYFMFHKEKLESPFLKTLFEEILSESLGRIVKVNYELVEPPEKKMDRATSLTSVQEPNIISSAQEIFGQ